MRGKTQYGENIFVDSTSYKLNVKKLNKKESNYSNKIIQKRVFSNKIEL